MPAGELLNCPSCKHEWRQREDKPPLRCPNCGRNRSMKPRLMLRCPNPDCACPCHAGPHEWRQHSGNHMPRACPWCNRRLGRRRRAIIIQPEEVKEVAGGS